MWLTKFFTIAILLFIAVQDFKQRAVYWLAFFLLLVVLLLLRLQQGGWHSIGETTVINSAFLLLQWLLVTVCFSIRNKQVVNITVGMLGWGDILFLSCIAFYLPVMNFLFFYMLSLTLILIFWTILQMLSSIRHSTIPLAGCQALILLTVLSCNWWISKKLDITNDTWLIKLINP